MTLDVEIMYLGGLCNYVVLVCGFASFKPSHLSLFNTLQVLAFNLCIHA